MTLLYHFEIKYRGNVSDAKERRFKRWMYLDAVKADYAPKEDEILYMKRENSGVTIQTEAGERGYCIRNSLKSASETFKLLFDN